MEDAVPYLILAVVVVAEWGVEDDLCMPVFI